jgi:FKBP-type peptidyl-prolyl cis-trans isomerase 2
VRKIFSLVSALIVTIMPMACKPAGIHAGSLVRIRYALSVDGKVVDSSDPKIPYEFKFGAGQVPAGLEEQLQALQTGDERTITVPPERGYGLIDRAAVQHIPLASFGDMAKDLQVGKAVDGIWKKKPVSGRVIGLDDKTVTLDFNHPLAGKTLVFNVKILSIAN